MDLEEMLGGSISRSGGNKVAISGEEREKFAELMQHIPNLKAGDKVQWKRGLKSAKMPANDEVVEVFRVFPINGKGKTGTNHECDENDFSMIWRDGDGDIEEYPFDSRRFERVE